MICEKSRLYERHPDWVLKAPNCSAISHGRNQYILDLTRKDVRDYLYDTISHLLESANIAYVKWDMNRNMTEIGSSLLEASRQGEVAHRYILGLYELLERLINKFPHVLFESCASGGNRFDLVCFIICNKVGQAIIQTHSNASKFNMERRSFTPLVP